jgi:hypothetical protein
MRNGWITVNTYEPNPNAGSVEMEPRVSYEALCNLVPPELHIPLERIRLDTHIGKGVLMMCSSCQCCLRLLWQGVQGYTH